MIHSARPTVSPVANIVFCCFVLLNLKSGDRQTTYAKTMIPTGRDCELAEWINCVSVTFEQVSFIGSLIWNQSGGSCI